MMLVIDRKGSTVWHENGCLLVNQPGSGKRRFPLTQLEQVIVYGNPSMELSACRILAAAGIPLLLLPSRGPDNSAMLSSGLATQLPLRRMQHRCADSPEQALQIARWLITSKLTSYDLPLRQFESISAAQHEEFLAKRNNALHTLEKATSIAAISGIEGGIARAWFQLLADQLPTQWKFSGRNRRPPRDPVNALLSLGYTLAQSILRQAVISVGFDPALGFVHQQYPAREALVLDLLETFRAGVDDLIIALVTSEQLSPDNFYYRDTEGCRLNKKSRPVFYNAWAQRLEQWPALYTSTPVATPLREQAVGQARRLRDQLKQRTPGHA